MKDPFETYDEHIILKKYKPNSQCMITIKKPNRAIMVFVVMERVFPSENELMMCSTKNSLVVFDSFK